MNGQKFRELVAQRQTEAALKELLGIIEARGISVEISIDAMGWSKEHRQLLYRNQLTMSWESTEEEWWLREAALKRTGYVAD